MDKEGFIKKFNQERKANKNKWVMIIDSIGSVEVRMKSYNTWIQLLYIGGIKYSGPMDCSVKDMNKFLEGVFYSHNWQFSA